MRLILAFAFSYFFFLAAPVLLRIELGPGPTPTLGAMLDLATPFVLIGLYVLLYRAKEEEPAREGPLKRKWCAAFFVFFAVLFVEGHGMHLSANSISSFLRGSPGSEAYAIAYFYDEVLSHYLWHMGALGLTGVLLARHWGKGKVEARRALLALASLAYGLTYAIAATESQTVPLDLPASLAIAGLFGTRWWKGRALPGDVVFAFFGLGYAVAAVTLAAWGFYLGGFPQPSQLLVR